MRCLAALFLGAIVANSAVAEAQDPQRAAMQACRSQARSSLGTGPETGQQRFAFVEACMRRAGYARPGGADRAERMEECRRRMRVTFAPGKVSGGRGDAGVSREVRQAFLRDCLREGR